MGSIESIVKDYGLSLGFDVVGITSAEPFLRDEKAAIKRIRQGLMGGLPWYTEDRVHKATHPEVLLPGARSIISLAMGYLGEDRSNHDSGPRGRIARYAWGSDYHNVLKSRLKTFVMHLSDKVGKPLEYRIFVDDGPMIDRAAAERAGVGWFGKNTNIITPSHGSWVLLAQVITDLQLKPDPPLSKNCGTCIQCIIDCPTKAIVAPYVVDNTRCISFYTIELRGAVPREMRSLIGDWVFGCDICQEVCPPNRKARLGSEPSFEQRHDFSAPELIPLLSITEEEFRQRFSDSPIKRAKRIGLQRNVCIALGNIGDPSAIPTLTEVLDSSEPLVRLHAAWALGQIGGIHAENALKSASSKEQDISVLEEIEVSLENLFMTTRSNRPTTPTDIN